MTVRVLLLLCLLTGLALGQERDSEGLTPLHRAAARGQTQEVRRLLDQGADLWALDSRMGVSVLHKAVYSGKADTVELLLQRGALIDLQSPSNGDTPLHDAIYFQPGDDASVIETLLRHHASLAIRNRAGLTPVDSCRLLKKEGLVRLLEAEARRRLPAANRDLMEAVRAGDEARVTHLLESPVDLRIADEEGFTPLLWAAREGQQGIVSRLLAAGADPNQNDAWMHANAGHKAAFWGRAEVLELLAGHGLDLNARGGYNGYTPLHDAVAGNHYEAARVLVEHGARTDIQGHDGKTPLDIARANGNQAILQLLASPLRRP